MKLHLPLAFVLLVGLAACGSSAPPSTPDAAEDSTSDLGSETDTGAPADVPDSVAPDSARLDTTLADTAADAPDARDALGEAAMDARGGCRDNTDCAANEFGFRVCDSPRGMCVACTSANRGSCTAGQYCTPANRCEPGCAVDSDCTSDAGAFRCDAERHVCVGCVRDDQCPLGSLCGPGSLCAPGCNEGHGCPAGETCCGGACRRVQTDVAHCGACGRACAAANGVPGCVAGACTVAACASGYGDCDGMAANGCEASLAADPSHCATCGRACPTGTNAAAVCAEGRCALRCAPGFFDCNALPADGCEVDGRTNLAHCGACGNACAAGPNATATCAAGRCGFVCAAGFGDCDGNPANGCEAQLASDPSRCGTCSTVCAGGTNARPSCAAGVCRVTCTDGFADCDGNTTNGCEASLDGTGSCGMCGVLCGGSTPLCGGTGMSRACTSGCAMGQSRCGASCVDLLGSVTDCGACGIACATPANASRTCAAGRCGFVCEPGFGDCDTNPANGCEVFLGTDGRHCGACGNACRAAPNASGACLAGRCGLACDAGFGDCNADPADGCETDTRTTPAHCGLCGRRCADGARAEATCAASVCGLRCDSGFADCDRNATNGCETDTRSDPASCGACGASCPTGVCASGRCGSLESCRTLHELMPSAPSGLFTIDPDGAGEAPPREVYCDMTTDGGGWTLVAYASRGSVAALNTDTGVRNLYSLATGGGTYDGLGRRGVASLPAVPLARRSREMLLSRSDTDFFTGPIAGYDVANKFTIPSPSTVNFLNSNPAVALAERGPCVPVVLTTLRGPSATGAMRYVFQNTLSVSWTDTYPTSYGVLDTSSCVNGSLGPNYVSDYTGVGNLRSYPWPRAADGAAHTYWHLGWWDATSTSHTGSVAIWLR